MKNYLLQIITFFFIGFSFGVDDLNARWVLLDATRQSRYSYSFSDLIRYELHQNATAEIDNMNTALLGASAPRTVRHICRMMYLDIFVNDIRTPRRRITFLDSYTETGSDKYRYAQDTAQNIIALLDYIDINRIRAAQIDTPAGTLDIASTKRDMIQNIIALLNYINANRNSSAEIGMLTDVSDIATEQDAVQQSAKRHEPQQITLWDLASSSAQSKESNDIAESSVQTDGTRRK